MAFGLVGATAVSLIQALPAALVESLAGLALLPVILQAFQLSIGQSKHTIGAGIALLIGASNLTILGINSTFWAIVAGVVLARALRRDTDEDK